MEHVGSAAPRHGRRRRPEAGHPQPAGGEAELVLRLTAMTERLDRKPPRGLRADGDAARRGPGRPRAGGVKVERPPPDMSRDMEASRQPHEGHPSPREGRVQHQLPPASEVLFDRLACRGKKTAKTKAASTAEDVLEELASSTSCPQISSTGVQNSSPPTSTPARDGGSETAASSHLQPDGAATGALRDRPEPPEHPHPHGEGGASARLRASGDLLLSRTTPRSSCASSPPLEGPTLSTPSAGARTSTTAPRGRSSALSPIPRPSSAASPRWSTTRCSTEDRFQPGQGHRRLPQGGGDLHRGLLRRYPKVRTFIERRSRRRARPARAHAAGGCGGADLRSKNFPVRMEAERQAMNTPSRARPPTSSSGR